MSIEKKKVLIIDDSAMIREFLTKCINEFPEFIVIGSAENPKIGAEKIIELNPDMITLDIEMPVMDGLTFLEKLMRFRPLPVVMFSSYTDRNSKAALMALELGAVDYIKKPPTDLFSIKDELHSKLLACRLAKVTANPKSGQGLEKKFTPQTQLKSKGQILKPVTNVIAIGASTGGTVALTKLFNLLPSTLPPIVIVQHMPAGFTKTFADRLNNEGSILVKEAVSDDLLLPGHAYVAPGGKQTEVILSSSGTKLSINAAPIFNRHCPSVDVLFNSMAKNLKGNGVGVIMTGMGDDGASGLLLMKQNGATTLAQDEGSCVVYGMPKVAVSKGAVTKSLDIEGIAKELTKFANNT